MNDLPLTAVPATNGGKRPLIQLTDAAETRMVELLATAPSGVTGLRLSTPQKGCSGFSYAIGFAQQAGAEDEIVDCGAGLLFIDRGSLPYLAGTVIDWQDDDFSPGFVFRNPNASGSCGCGDSFTVTGGCG